jgi:hypothetical protein
MSALSENNVQNVTNRAFPLRGKEKEKKIANTLVHHAVILYELSVHRALSRYSELYY